MKFDKKHISYSMMILHMLMLSFLQLCSNVVYKNIKNIPAFSFVKSKFILITIASKLFGGKFQWDFNIFLRSALVLLAEYYQISGFKGLSMMDITLHFAALPFLTNFLFSYSFFYLIPVGILLLIVKKFSLGLFYCCLCYSVGEVLISRSTNQVQDEMYTSSLLLSLIPCAVAFSPTVLAASVGNTVVLNLLFFIFSTYSFANILPWRVIDIIISLVFDAFF